MNKFTKKTVEEIKPLKKNRHLKAKFSAVLVVTLFLFTFFGLFVYLVKEYKDTHTFHFQSPIIIQKPVIIKRVEIISPMASKSAMLNTAYAEEIKNPFDPRSPKGVAWELVKEKWGIQEWGAFEELIMRESGWHNWSVNSESGASGLGQALGHKDYTCELWDYECQLNWTVSYIYNRYNTPSKALEFHNVNNYY